MKKIKIARLTLNACLENREIPQFRAAVAALVRKDGTLFHHHLNDQDYNLRKRRKNFNQCVNTLHLKEDYNNCIA